MENFCQLITPRQFFERIGIVLSNCITLYSKLGTIDGIWNDNSIGHEHPLSLQKHLEWQLDWPRAPAISSFSVWNGHEACLSLFVATIMTRPNKICPESLLTRSHYLTCINVEDKIPRLLNTSSKLKKTITCGANHQRAFCSVPTGVVLFSK